MFEQIDDRVKAEVFANGDHLIGPGLLLEDSPQRVGAWGEIPAGIRGVDCPETMVGHHHDGCLRRDVALQLGEECVRLPIGIGHGPSQVRKLPTTVSIAPDAAVAPTLTFAPSTGVPFIVTQPLSVPLGTLFTWLTMSMALDPEPSPTPK